MGEFRIGRRFRWPPGAKAWFLGSGGTVGGPDAIKAPSERRALARVRTSEPSLAGFFALSPRATSVSRFME